MSYGEWARGPFGMDAAMGATVRTERTVLAVVHSVDTGAWLADVLPVLSCDRRVQVVVSAVPSLFPGGVVECLHDMGAAPIPWQLAVRERFDLAISAGTGQLERVRAPVVLMPHGMGYGPGEGPPAARHAHGAERQQLAYHGRVVPAAILVAHQDRAAQLRRSCPEATPAVVVAGDPCHDRLAASLPLRRAYRRALGIRDDQKLVLVTSTWGPGSLLGQAPGLLPRLLAELPASRYRIAASLHPDAWHWHGPGQVQAWHADCVRSGLIPLPAVEGWRAALVAADMVIGDHGSVTQYAASLGVPVLLAAFPGQDVPPGSPAALLGRTAPRLRFGQPLLPQLTQAASHWPEQYAGLLGQLTSEPGRARQVIRQVLYRQLGLTEPPGIPATQPVPLPILPVGGIPRALRDPQDGTGAGSARRALCVAVDIKGWSRRPAPEQARAQQALATVVRAACAAAGLPGEFAQVNGDGVLLVAPSGIDETRVIPVFIRALHDALRHENRMLSQGARIRLRTALTEGMIIPAPTGFAGLAVTECSRLLDSPPVRQALDHHPDADLAVIASDVLYHDVIAHGYHGLEPTSFQPADCSIPDKGFRAQAWICVPGQWACGPGSDGEELVSELVVADGDFPWLSAEVRATQRFGRIRPLFEEELR